ncbi:hypothetical protein [Goodfellowiella coeruleoviolacea]|uniref:[acyl-carrier-protein] S-malonyltransferase n=1 Tax=Goodfellowiella coeruleoviolacea TaxID=334858 RepID=A0AAE3KLF4_9PSEU|nr:hypothetical protein [Goodfellowiella coeruleoviolacea]MCP2170269.1 [acyl-carrier-protein] S-malonyltransferase [Goodfellowiella coeruleoviolacea]
MTLGYILTAGIPLEPPGTALYDSYPVMRRWCDQVAEWTGLDHDQLLTQDLTTAVSLDADSAEQLPRHEVAYTSQVRQIMNSLGIADILAEMGLRPNAIGGLSLGAFTAACLAGSLERRDLLDLVAHITKLPTVEPGKPPTGMAIGTLPVDADLDWYCGDSRPGVYLGADNGVYMGQAHVVMFSGYVDALETLAAEAPAGQITVMKALNGGHTPLQQFAYDLRKPYVDKVAFHDPRVPLFSGLRDARLETGDDVRADILDNTTRPIHLAHVNAGLARYGVRAAIVPGVAIPVAGLEFPFPVVQVSTAEDVGKAAAILYELGIEVEPR